VNKNIYESAARCEHSGKKFRYQLRFNQILRSVEKV
jgi:hypothetical protein